MSAPNDVPEPDQSPSAIVSGLNPTNKPEVHHRSTKTIWACTISAVSNVLPEATSVVEMIFWGAGFSDAPCSSQLPHLG